MTSFVYNFIQDNPITTYDGRHAFCLSHKNIGQWPLNLDSLVYAKNVINKPSTKIYYLLVPVGLVDAACNAVKGDSSIKVVEVPFWTNDNNWVLISDPQKHPFMELAFLSGHVKPKISFKIMNNGLKFAITHIYGVNLLSHEGMYKSFPLVTGSIEEMKRYEKAMISWLCDP